MKAPNSDMLNPGESSCSTRMLSSLSKAQSGRYMELEQTLARDGFGIVPDVISHDFRNEVVSLLEQHPQSRTLLDQPWCRELARGLRTSALAPVLPDSLSPVQCTYFDKSQHSNWFVAWHQDLTIPVNERVKSSACTAWTRKQGTTFVQPPLSVLEQLVSVRLHLDESDDQNGPLRVIPSSHRHGRLGMNYAKRTLGLNAEVTCLAPERSALVFKPLLLHASSRSRSARRRRVLHFLFGPRELPEGLRWQVEMKSNWR